MSGDSPNAHKNEVFDFTKDGRSSPVPTSSKDVAIQSSGIVQTSVAVDPDTKEKEEEPLEMCCPTLHGDTDDKTKKAESKEMVKFDDLDKDKGQKEKNNTNEDKLDGVWVSSKKDKTRDWDEDPEEDNCVVKCLYYTLQCCECSIM